MSEIAATGAPETSVSTLESRREKRRQRFLKVAAQRTRQVLIRLQLLSKCANRAVYEYGEEDVEKVFSAINEELADMRRKFDDRAKKRIEFSL